MTNRERAIRVHEDIINCAPGCTEDIIERAITAAVSDVQAQLDATTASLEMVTQERDRAREQRATFEQSAKRSERSYIDLLKECAAAQWTCPDCDDDAETPGECRECFIDEHKSVQRVPRAAIELAKERKAHAETRAALEELVRAALLLGEQLPSDVQPQWRWSAISEAIVGARNALAASGARKGDDNG